jgi:hypothetical protein
MRRSALLAGNVPADALDDSNGSLIEFTAAVEFKRRGVASKIVVPGLSQQNQASYFDPALIKAIARGRAWFDELATGRARSLRNLAERDGITRRYIRRLVDLAFLSPQLVDAILQGRQPAELTATRLTELDLPFETGRREGIRGLLYFLRRSGRNESRRSNRRTARRVRLR